MELSRKLIVTRMLARAGSCLYFIENHLRFRKGQGTDAAYSRSLYILLSYAAELILKSVLILHSKAQSYEEMEEEIKKPLHNLDSVFTRVTKDNWNNVGITSVTRSKGKLKYYSIRCSEGIVIRVEDFIDARYDFFTNELRVTDPNEVSRMDTEIKELLKLIKNISTSTGRL